MSNVNSSLKSAFGAPADFLSQCLVCLCALLFFVTELLSAGTFALGTELVSLGEDCLVPPGLLGALCSTFSQVQVLRVSQAKAVSTRGQPAGLCSHSPVLGGRVFYLSLFDSSDLFPFETSGFQYSEHHLREKSKL